MPKIPRFRFTIRSLLALAMLLAIFLASRNTLVCNYHQWALEHVDSVSSSWYVGSYEGHIKELARLGRYEQRKFILQKLPVDSIEARRLFTRLRSVRGVDAWLTMGRFGGGDESPEPSSVTVICAPDKMVLFQHLIETADTAFESDQD